MNSSELFEKFVSFLFDNGIALKPFFKNIDLSPDKRAKIIEKFLNSKIVVECGYCSEGYCTEIVYDTFGEPHRRTMQKRCSICSGTGKRLISVRSIISIRHDTI